MKTNIYLIYLLRLLFGNKYGVLMVLKELLPYICLYYIYIQSNTTMLTNYSSSRSIAMLMLLEVSFIPSPNSDYCQAMNVSLYCVCACMCEPDVIYTSTLSW